MKFLYFIKTFLSRLHKLRLYSLKRFSYYTDIYLIYCYPTNLFINFNFIIIEKYLFVSVISAYNNLRRTLILNCLNLTVSLYKANKIKIILNLLNHLVLVQKLNNAFRSWIRWNHQKTRFMALLFCILQQTLQLIIMYIHFHCIFIKHVKFRSQYFSKSKLGHFFYMKILQISYEMSLNKPMVKFFAKLKTLLKIFSP